MAYRPDDPYNTGIGTPDLGLGNIDQANNIELAKNLNINALKENPMFQGEFVPEKAGMMDFTYGAALKKIPEGISKYDLLKGVTEGTWGMGGGEVLEKNIGGIFPKGTFTGDWNTIGDADINLNQVPGSFKYNIDVDTENIKGKVLEDLEKKGWFDSDDQAMVPGTYDPKTGIPYQAGLLSIPAIKAMLAKYGKTRLKYGLASTGANILLEAKAKAKAKADAAAQAQAQASQRQADQARVSRAYREETGGQAGSYAPGGGSGAHAADASGSTYSDPFDPGGGEAQGGFIDGTNRRRNYLNGGLINFFKYGGFIG